MYSKSVVVDVKRNCKKVSVWLVYQFYINLFPFLNIEEFFIIQVQCV